jgi:F-type H+-transporting ATPase subunit b
MSIAELWPLLPIALTHLVGFLGFLWVIKKFAVGPVMDVLDERRDKIAGEFDKIGVEQKRIENLREEYEAHLREIDEEARKRVQEEVTRGRRIAEEMVENARSEASEVLEKARANTQLQIEQARQELKDEVIAMTLAATERLIQERLDEPKHREMVSAFIEELEQRN